MLSCTESKKEAGALHAKRVLILGNSITQNGANVDYLEYFLRKNYPDLKLDIISIGLSNETVNGASEKSHPYPTIQNLKNDPLFKVVAERRKVRSEGWRNYIGYT